MSTTRVIQRVASKPTPIGAPDDDKAAGIPAEQPDFTYASEPLPSASTTDAAETRVIHNHTKYPFPEAFSERRVPARRSSREPYRPCTVAILSDQGGRR